MQHGVGPHLLPFVAQGKIQMLMGEKTTLVGCSMGLKSMLLAVHPTESQANRVSWCRAITPVTV